MAQNFNFRIEANTERMTRKLTNFAQSQARWATVTTLNETGKFLLKQNEKHMVRTFAKTNAYTRNAFYLKRANKKTLTASIQRKDKPSGKHYLEVQKDGGTRPRKRLETKMKFNLPYDGIIEAVTPTTRGGGKFNNLLTSQANKVLDGINGKGGVRYFVAGPHSLRKFGGGNKTGGVYRVNGKRGKPQKIFHFHDRRMNYKPKFNYFENMNRNARQHFKMRFAANLRKAMQTSKFGMSAG
jgi:hypothetical protein